MFLIKLKQNNKENIRLISKLRHQRAQLLGYKTHAHFILEERMAINPDNVIKFLEIRIILFV